MADYKLYLICGGIVVIALLVIVATIVLYERKKKALQAEAQKKTRELLEKEQRVHHQLQEEEQRTRLQLQEAERQSQERIRIASSNLAKQQEDFNKKVEEFTREQRLREKLDSKTDREIAIEMHVKAMRIFEILSDMDGKLSGVKDYSTHIDHTFNNVTNAVEGLKQSLATSVAIIKSDLDGTKQSIYDTVCGAISDQVTTIDSSDIKNAVSEVINYDSDRFKSDLESLIREIVEEKVTTIDEDGIKHAISDALRYDYSFKDSIEDIVSDAVRNVVDSSLSVVEGHLYSIESKLD